jgi:rRNA maturation protein Nop10
MNMQLKKCDCKKDSPCNCQKYTLKDKCACNQPTKDAHYKFLDLKDETRDFNDRPRRRY